MAITIRIDEGVAEQVRAIALQEHRSIGQGIADAVSQYQKKNFWTDVHSSFTQLRANPAAWRDYRHETALLQGASMDGLEHEPPYYTAEDEAEIVALVGACIDR